MTQPYHRTTEVWNAKAASQTLTYLGADPNFPVENFGQIKLSLQLTTFSGTVDFQSSADNVNWFSIPYFRADNLVALVTGLLNAPSEFVLVDGGRVYVVPGGPWPYFRVVMTWSDGAIARGVLQGYEHDSGFV